MSAEIVIPEPLLVARRSLEGVPGVQIVGKWEWKGEVGRFVLPCSLSTATSQSADIPSCTQWFIHAETTYPWGSILFFPAKEGGITQTFPHQFYNKEGKSSVPWRTGQLCLTTGGHVLGREAYDSEPFGAENRLQWHVLRAISWLEDAANGTLVKTGEAYELPHFPLNESTGLLMVAFSENRASYQAWKQTESRIGFVELSPLDAPDDTFLVERFRTLEREELLVPNWGARIRAFPKNQLIGLWVRFNSTPVLPPWRVPMIWDELKAVCHNQGIDIEDLLRQGAPRLRDGRHHLMLMGFPIPENVGEEPVVMHWQALYLPVLSHHTKTAKGFRPKEAGYWRRDRLEILRDDLQLDWMKSENWHHEQISTRGRFTESIASKKILFIGAGTLGSAVSEIMARGGFNDFTVLDGETLEAGNLVRHNLTMAEVHKFKAVALADRLKLVSPHTDAYGFPSSFPPRDADLKRIVQNRDVIIETTGQDEVIDRLEHYDWQGPKLFLSLSVGFQARRLFCFAAVGDHFPQLEFRTKIRPWLEKELTESKGQAFPREGIGCWHIVFPARSDDIGLLAASGVKWIEEAMKTPPTTPTLVVFEQIVTNNSFQGVQRHG